MTQRVYQVNHSDIGEQVTGETGMYQHAIEMDNPAYEPQDDHPSPPYEPPNPALAQLPQVITTNGVNGATQGGKPRRASRVVKGSVLSCHDLFYTVKVPAPRGKGCCAKVDKEILRSVNGIFKPGMNGIMGPTGGGKTTMLDTLAGRKNKSCISGTLLLDGHEMPENFRCMSGYVVQDDVVMGTLTVRENIMFSANLRLPKTTSRSEKEERVEETLQELGLTRCADSKVGNEFIRGVSGGERKRTNIGMELIIGPRVLFLDEPTTGLDSSTSNAVMSLLKRLSKRGRTIIFSIHQPRYSIFKLFDRLTLMAAGRTAYHGPAQEALEYFSQIGYVCEEHNNPPDFFLDVINGDSTAVQSMGAHKDKLNDDDDEDMDIIDNGNVVSVNVVGSEPNKTLSETLADKYSASIWYKNVSEELAPIFSAYQNKKNAHNDIEDTEYATSFGTQMRYISKRNLLNILRNPQASVLQLIVTILFGVIVGLIFLRLGNKYESGIQNRIGVLFFVVVNQMFANLSAVELFIKERTIFLHETSSGFYRVSAFFFSKLFCDLIPLRIFPLICFSLITYFMVGLQEDAGKFFIFFFTLFLGTMCASAIGFAVSATVRVFAIANLLVSVCYVLMMIFGGLLVNVGKMGKWLSWLQYLSITRYGLNALSINELNDLVLVRWENGTKILDAMAGPKYLTDQGIDHGSAWDLWQNHLALGLICIGVMTIAYIQLRRLKENK